MGILTREQVLDTSDLPIELVEVPEWGGSVYVRGMNLEEMLSLAGSEDKPLIDQATEAIVSCVVDENSEPIFRSEDIPALRRKSSGVIMKLAGKVNELSGLKGDLGKDSRPAE